MTQKSLFLELLPSLLDATRDHAVVVLDAEGVIADWLGAGPVIFGHTAAEAIGQPYGLIFTNADRERALHLQELEVARRDQRSEDDRWHLRKDGSVFWGSGVLEAVRKADGSLLGFCKILRDRTDLRVQLDTFENRALAHEKELVRRNRFLTQLVHELRNPLGPLLNAGALLERTDDRALRARYFEVVTRQIEVLKHLLDDMYEAARVTLSRIQISPRMLSLHEVIGITVAGVQGSADARQQELRLTLPEVPIELEADPERLQQMLLNLLVNAIKYTPAGGHISVTAAVEGEQAVVRVEDDGIGIPPDMLASIFDMFTREEWETGKGAPEGLGVGLATVKELARLHHGSIEARSSGKNAGSMFTLRLPLKQPNLGV
jgi:PAS domain S-box-containing protein